MLRCGECGCSRLPLKNAKGSKFPYKDEDLILSSDIDLRTCEDCGNTVLSTKDIIKLDKLLEKDYEEKKQNEKNS